MGLKVIILYFRHIYCGITNVLANIEGWYYFGSLPINNSAAIAQHLINLKRQIDDSVLYIKETKVNNKLKKIKEDFQ